MTQSNKSASTAILSGLPFNGDGPIKTLKRNRPAVMPRRRRRKLRFLPLIKHPTRPEMEETVQRAIGGASAILYNSGHPAFFATEAPKLCTELMEVVDNYARSWAIDNAGWRTWFPEDSGYYLAAWKKGPDWVVSELWYNPGSIGTGWWQSRIYLHQEDHSGRSVEVVAWMPMPEFKPPKEG
jgi:hypothetical protein